MEQCLGDRPGTGMVQRREAVLVLRYGVCSGGQQSLCCYLISDEVQRRVAMGVAGVRIGMVVQQQSGNAFVSRIGGVVQGGATVFIQM